VDANPWRRAGSDGRERVASGRTEDRPPTAIRGGYTEEASVSSRPSALLLRTAATGSPYRSTMRCRSAPCQSCRHESGEPRRRTQSGGGRSLSARATRRSRRRRARQKGNSDPMLGNTHGDGAEPAADLNVGYEGGIN